MKFYIAAFCASCGVGVLAMGLLMPLAKEHLGDLESLLGFSGFSKKIESGPGVVVAVSSAKSLISDADYFSKSFGVDPSMLRMVKNGIDRALVGVDQDRPLGVACYFVPRRTDPYVLFAVPVTDFDRFVASLEGFGSVSQSKLTFQPLGQPKLMIRKQNDYALLSADEPAFKLAPENPFTLFKDSADTHRIACQIYGNRIPERSKDEFFKGFKKGFKKSAKKRGSFALADADLQDMLAEVKEAIYNTDSLFWGVDFDRRRRSLIVDFEIEGSSESRYAKTAILNRDLPPSRFAGFAREACAFDAVIHTNVPKEDAASLKKSLQMPLEQFKTELADNFVDGKTDKFVALAEKTLGVLQETFESGNLDMGANIEVGSNYMTLAMGASVPDPAKFESAGKELFKFICSADESARITENADEYQGVVFHELVANVPATNEQVLPFGREIKLVIGIAEKDVYLAVGSDPMDSLKKSIDDSTKVSGDIPVVVSNISLSHWSHLMIGDDPQIRMFKQILSDIGGQDKVALKVESTGRGQRMRFSMDTAVITSAQKFAKQQWAGAGGKRRTVGSRSKQGSASGFRRLQRANGNPSSGARGVGDAEADFLRRVYSN